MNTNVNILHNKQISDYTNKYTQKNMQNDNLKEQRKWLVLQDGPCGDCISNAHVKPILQQYLLTNETKQMLFV